MGATENTYLLHIVRAVDLLFAADSTMEVPSAYVEVSVGDFLTCTRVIEQSANPSWDEAVEWRSADPAAFLYLKVIQHASMRPHQLLGSVRIQIKTLLEMHEDSGEDVILKLHPPQLETESSIQEAGHVVIYLIQEDTELFDESSNLSVVNDTMNDLISWVADEEIPGSDSEQLKLLLSEGPSHLCVLGHACKLKGGVENIHNSIVLYKAAVKLTPVDHADRAAYLNYLSDALDDQFCLLGNIEDIKEAVLHQKEAILITMENDPHLPDYMNNLSIYLQRSFEHLGDIADLNMAIQHQEKALNTTPEGHPQMPGCLNNLGSSFMTRFQHLGDFTDLNMAIQHQEKALNTTPEGHPDLSIYLNNLGISFQTYFKHLGHVEDLNKAIQYKENAVNTTPEGHPDLAGRLSNLGNSFQSRFEHLGHIEDLNKAIQHQEKAVNTTTEGHPDLSMYLNSLGNAFQSHFEHTGDTADLNKAIQYQKKAVNTTSEGHQNFPDYLSNLGNSFQRHFEHLGDISDLNIAIHYHEKAINATSESHPGLPGHLNNLGNSFQRRFEYLGDVTDLNMAIHHLEKAVNTVPKGHPSLSMYLNNLGNAFHIHFTCIGDPADLNKAIQYQKNAVNTTPEGHSGLSIYLNNLGISFRTYFGHSRDIADLNMAIHYEEKAVNTTPEGHPDLPAHLNNLGYSYQQRFEHLGDIADLKIAIDYLEKSVHATPESNLGLSMYLNNLGISFQRCFEHLGENTDLERAIASFAKGAQILGPASHCFTAALNWIKCVNSTPHDTFSHHLKAYTCTLQLLPRLAWLGQNIESRYDQLLKAGSVACDAAAIAIQNEDAQKSVELLEQGRSIVWGQILQLHTPLDALKEIQPTLASKLSQLSSKLEYGKFATTKDHHDAAQQWERLITEIRNIPKFHEFLLPKGYSELSTVSHYGFVIIVNVSSFRCDALVMKSPETPPHHIHLNGFSLSKAEQMKIRLYGILNKKGLRSQWSPNVVRAGGIVGIEEEDECFRSILTELWLNVVKPILSELSLMDFQEHILPRLWWCPTGPLTFLPLHAAGIYPANQNDKVACLADYAISSYTPTLAALAASQKAHQITKNAIRFLAVIQPDIPTENNLPGTLKELAIIEQHTAKHQMLTTLAKTNATVEKVVSAMGECSWVHFACHGIQDLDTPTKSGFALDGGRLELSKIISQSVPCADFAFLSACQTAAGDPRRPDETIHLAAGMMSAGYHSVIATMWSIGDNEAPFIADEVYSHLLADKEPSSQKAAEALHLAVQTLRKRYNSESFISWVPFIHMGT